MLEAHLLHEYSANAMANKGGGSIINIASIYGMVAPDMKIYEDVDFETEPDYHFSKEVLFLQNIYHPFILNTMLELIAFSWWIF